MMDKQFSHPVTVETGGGTQYAVVASVCEAVRVLIEGWPAEQGPRHRDALDTCYKVLDGHRSTEDAASAFRDAALEAGILVDDED